MNSKMKDGIHALLVDNSIFTKIEVTCSHYTFTSKMMQKCIYEMICKNYINYSSIHLFELNPGP